MAHLLEGYVIDKSCKICHADEYKYICPRCGIAYCSVQCYRNPTKHLECSEAFYRECVVHKLQQEQNPVKVKKMKELLQRFHEQYKASLVADYGEQPGSPTAMEEEPLDSDDEQPLGKRMKGVDLDNSALVWDKLTPEERTDFKRFAREYEARKNGEETFTLNPGPPLVEEVGEADGEEPTPTSSTSASVFLN